MNNKVGYRFLTAEWRNLAMLNYEIPPEILQPLVPKGTELDTWNRKLFVSVVGFLFLNTRVLGVSIPFHRDFEEINLRFYVRRHTVNGWRRGVVFVKEIVPRCAIAYAARHLYNENYVALPTGHAIRRKENSPEDIESVKYFWTFQGRENVIEVVTRGSASPFVEGSEEEFITQHFWGYSSQKDGGTVEYRVEHPAWRIWQAKKCHLDCDAENFYGKEFADVLRQSPSSAFLAEGSDVLVYRGRRLAG